MSGSSDFLDFRGRVVLITGAATGIGRAVAVAFAAHGAKVSIGDVNEESVGETLKLVKEAGGEVIFRRTDVSEEADVQRLVSETVGYFGRLDCAFNNAGIAPKDADRRPMAQVDTSGFDRLISVNLRGVFLCMKYELRETSLGPHDDLIARLCLVRVFYENIPSLLPKQAVEAVGVLLATPGCEIPDGCITTIDDLHRFAEMLRRGGELDGARVLSPAMIEFCARNWITYPAYIGVGFFVRGDGNMPGHHFSVMNSPNTFGGFGAGASGFTIDPRRDLTLALLSTGLMEDSYHLERMATMATLVLAAMTK